MKNTKIQSIIRTTLFSAFILLSYPDPVQAAQFIEDGIREVGSRVYGVIRPDIQEGLGELEDTFGRPLPRIVRDPILPPTIGQRICRVLNSIPYVLSRGARNLGVRLGLIERPGLFERFDNALDDLLE